MHKLFLRNQTIFDTCELCRTLIFIATYAQKEEKRTNLKTPEREKSRKRNKTSSQKERNYRSN
jgi:hypothetical protein